MAKIFTQASMAAWHDLETKRFSIHDFRDFFQSKLESAGINSNMISPFLAHRVKGTDAHYSNHQVDELRESFRIALPYLLPQSIEKVKAETQLKLTQLETNLNKATEDLAKLQPLTALFTNEEQLKQFIRLLKGANFKAETDVPEIIDNYVREGAKEEGKTERKFLEEVFERQIKSIKNRHGIDLAKTNKKSVKNDQKRQDKTVVR
jgi:hypothetical protein